jgi:hypothetical protein
MLPLEYIMKKRRTLADMTIEDIETLQLCFTPEEWDFRFHLMWEEYKGRDVSHLMMQ